MTRAGEWGIGPQTCELLVCDTSIGENANPTRVIASQTGPVARPLRVSLVRNSNR